MTATLTGGAEYFGRSLEWTADDYEVSDGAIQDRLDRFRNDPPMAV